MKPPCAEKKCKPRDFDAIIASKGKHPKAASKDPPSKAFSLFKWRSMLIGQSVLSLVAYNELFPRLGDCPRTALGSNAI